MSISGSTKMWITLMIPTLLALSTVLAHDGGLMDIHVVASKEVEVNLKYGSNNFYFPVRQHRSFHMSIYPSQFTSDDFFHITVGLLNSSETTQDAKFLLVPRYSQEVLKFQNVTVILQAYYKCADGRHGVRCAMKNVFRNQFETPVIPLAAPGIVSDALAPIGQESDENKNVIMDTIFTIITDFLDVLMILIVAKAVVLLVWTIISGFRVNSESDNNDNDNDKANDNEEQDDYPLPPNYIVLHDPDENVEPIIIIVS